MRWITITEENNKTTISDEIDIQIAHQIQQIPTPIQCKIKEVYSQHYVDVTTSIGDFEYIKLIGYTKKDADGLVVFVDGNPNNPICISVNVSYILEKLNEVVNNES